MELQLLDALMREAGELPAVDDVEIIGEDPIFPLTLPVGEAGAASIAATGVAASRIWKLKTGRSQKVRVEVDAAAAAMRGDKYLRRAVPSRQTEPSPSEIRGQRGDIYQAGDGRWVYLHRGFRHHRALITELLGGANDEQSIERAVLAWDAFALEDAVHAAGACGGMIRSHDEWDSHPQGIAVAALPLMEVEKIGDSAVEPFPEGPRPLSGIRALDLTRVLAGPTCARTLAEHGAEVLRVCTDLLPNNEAQMIATGHGKRSTIIDLTSEGGRELLRGLVRGADVFSQSYRPGSLADRGFGLQDVAAMRPGIVYVSLSAFGHEGPWQQRRGFDTLVQCVSGISDEYAANGRPRHLPVSVLDYVTGYLAAFGVMVALSRRAQAGGSYHVRVSLAQTAKWLTALPRIERESAMTGRAELSSERIAELMTTTETLFGPITHLKPIAHLSETPARWDSPPVPLDHDPPVWQAAE